MLRSTEALHLNLVKQLQRKQDKLRRLKQRVRVLEGQTTEG